MGAPIYKMGDELGSKILDDASEKIGLHEVLFLLINFVYVSLNTINPCL